MHEESLPKLQTLTNASGTLEYCIFHAETNKPLLLVIHGLGGNAHSIKYTAPFLKDTFTVVGVSLPFHGNTEINSPYKANYLGFVSLIDDLVTSLNNKWNFSECNICAHSIGAIFAVHCVLSTATFYKNLILLAPAGFGSFDQSFFKFVQKKLGKWLLSQDLFLRYFSNKLWKIEDPFSRRLFMQQLQQLFLATSEYDLISNRKMHLLYGVSATVSVLWAKDDSLLPYHYSTEVANHFQRSTISLLNEGGHNLLKNRAEYIANHLLKLI